MGRGGGVSGGRITWVGADADADDLVGRGTDRHRGRLVLPGFIDSHNHVRLGSDADCVQLAGAGSLAEVRARIAAWLGEHPDATIDDIHNPSVLCIAWGQPESGWEAQAIASMDEALAKAAARSITICCAAGDNGPTAGVTDGKAHVDFPASSPYVLACGGTRIAASESRVETEDVWNDGPAGGTGGGFSDVFPVPAWQESIFMTNSIMSGKPPGRGLPDIAANASPLSGYQVLLDGKWMVLGGTSCVAPLWAGLIARINQGLGQRVGFFNPALYRNLGPAGTLRAITDGSTKKGNKPGLGFQAGAGWDPCTGWGVPSGQRLLFALKVLQTTQQTEQRER